jgi:hypothetical protein
LCFGDRRHQSHGVAADVLRAHEKAAGAVEGPADHTIALGLRDRCRLAADHGFVGQATALDDLSIDWDFLAGSHPKQVANRGLFQCDIFFAGASAG